MKFQPKRFIVEVKRGTNRAAFSSPDAGLDKFSAAEAMLFGTAAAPAAAEAPQKAKASAAPPRRILESLAEAPAAPPAPPQEVAAERPRRGRKPGSKNRPKVLAEAAPAAQPVLSAAALAFMNAPAAGRAAPPPVPAPEAADAAQPILVPAEAIVVGAAATEFAGEGRRGRLRERSSIIQRYVLGTVPQPGQTGSLRARKLARAAAAGR